MSETPADNPVEITVGQIELFCKNAMSAYVFEPNIANTWEAVITTLTAFLVLKWKQGLLSGTSPADAFSVACGLGSTMTPMDILAGNLKVSINLALPGITEHTVVSITQQMHASA